MQNNKSKMSSIMERLLKPFRIKTGDDEIKEFYMKMRRRSTDPTLYVRFNRQINNVECLIATDLSAAFSMQNASEIPELKALAFLKEMADMNILGLDAAFLKENLSIQDVTQSNLGIHCVFGLRYNGKIINENSFIVHLDNNLRIVMLFCVYQQSHELAEDVLESLDDNSQIEGHELLPLYADERASLGTKLKSAIEKEFVILPDWSRGIYLSLKEIEIITTEGNFIWLVDKDWRIHRQYAIHAGYSGLGTVIDNFWYGDQNPPPEEEERSGWHFIQETPLPTKKIILRDLQSTEGHLAGKYVKVEDTITKNWTFDKITIDSDDETNSSFLDRVQAYYHIDYIQRYFRDLGLTVLDKELNPLRVVLTNEDQPDTTSYMPTEKTIYFKQIALHSSIPNNNRAKSFRRKRTDARDCMIVYHEYIHAVTDVLASIRRHDLNDTNHPRYRDMLQAAAMDEGIADYFACSLAVAHGAREPRICTLRQIQDKRLARKIQRDIGPIPQLQLVHQAEQPQPSEHEQIIYRWGEEWGRFLWQLRSHAEIGAEVADTLIAHSILYLTRWSNFSMGILAIMLADQLLFKGTHRELIRELSSLNIKRVSKKPKGPLRDEAFSVDAIQVDFGLNGAAEDDAEAKDQALEFGVDPYVVDEWVFEENELSKIRYRINIEEE